MNFQIDFFDGITSKKYQAKLKVDSLNWIISYVNDDGKTTDLFWDVDHINKSTVITKNWVVFTYGSKAPFQKIESSDINFIAYLEESKSKKFVNLFDIFIHRSLKKSLVVLIGILLGLGVLTYIYVIPQLALKFVSNLSDEHVSRFGDYVFKVISNEIEIDTLQTKQVQEFVDNLTLETSFPIKVYIANSNALNAFALSGGHIVIFSSLLDKIESEAQLLALIAHEVSHIENRDVLKNITRDLSGSLFVSILIGDLNGISNVLMENAHMFTQLSYSRSLEKNADIYGLEIMKNNHVDLNGMPQLFTIFKENQSFEISAYISNHPALDDRINYTTEIANKNQINSNENKTLKEQWKKIKVSIEK